MKITIEPETELEKQEIRTTTVAGLKSVAVIGVAYDADVLRQPYSFSYGDLRDLMREMPVTALDMAVEVLGLRPKNNGR